MEPVDRVAHNPIDHFIEVVLRVGAAGFAGLNRLVVKSGCTGAGMPGSKYPVLPYQRQVPERILSRIIVRLEATVSGGCFDWASDPFTV